MRHPAEYCHYFFISMTDSSSICAPGVAVVRRSYLDDMEKAASSTSGTKEESLSPEQDCGAAASSKVKRVSSLLKIKIKRKDSDSDSEKRGFFRRSVKSKKEPSERSNQSTVVSEEKSGLSSKASTIVRKLSFGRRRNKGHSTPDLRTPTSADSATHSPQETSDEDQLSAASSIHGDVSSHEGYDTPAATPPLPLTPPPMEVEEDQSQKRDGSSGGGAVENEAPPPVQVSGTVYAVTPPAPHASSDHSLPDMKGEGEVGPPVTTIPTESTGAIKKAKKSTSRNSTNSLPEVVVGERKTTRSQLLSITSPALQKQMQQNGTKAMAEAAAAAAAKEAHNQSLAETRTEVRIVAEIGGVPDDDPDSTMNGPASMDIPSGMATGDLMADARNRLSQSLGAQESAQMSGEKREHLYKILVIGELGTGKTSIIKRYVHQFFSQHYRATIGVDFALKVLNWDPSTIIRLQLWDIAGQERFGNMTRVYYKEAVGAFIVFDVTRASTFDAVVKWKQDLDSKVQMADGTPIPCVLLANKCDQPKEGLVNSPAKMDEYCRDKGFTAWFETSAKENVNIEEAARALVGKILQNDKLLHGELKDPTKISLDNNGKVVGDSSSGKSCAC